MQQGVVREVDTGHQVRRAKRHLLRFGEEVVGPAVEHHAADDLERHQLLGDKLGRIEVVEGEASRFLFSEQLHRKLPLRECPGLNGLEQVAAVKVGVGASDLDGLVPDRRLQAQLGPPVKLHEGGVSRGVDEAEAVNTKAFDHAQRARQGAVGHDPHHHVHRLRRQRDVVPEGVMRAGRLREAAVGLHLHRVDQVGELDRILDEEHRQVVAYQVPVALLAVELDGKATHVARRVDRASAPGHRRDACEDGCAFTDLGQDLRGGVVGQRLGQLEEAMRRRTARMHDALGDALMVEVGDFLAQDEVFKQRRPFRVRAQRVLVVGDRCAMVGRQGGVFAGHGLVQLTARADVFRTLACTARVIGCDSGRVFFLAGHVGAPRGVTKRQAMVRK